MKLTDINLNNIKLVVFDFDDTLAIHKDKDFSKHRRESEENLINFYYNAYNNPNCFYDEIEPCTRSEVLYNLIDILRSKNIKMYCLSGMKFSFHLKAKQAFVNKHYGEDIEVIATSSQELKLIGLKILKKISNCNSDEILLIDDRQDVIDLLIENGINGINVKDLTI